MKPREIVASAAIPGHGAALQCWHHDGAHALWLGRTELMSSRVHESEEALAELAVAARGKAACKRILVGGLGMGFTLAKLLTCIEADAKVEVVELVPEVVAWNHDVFGHHAGHPLRDGRVQVRIGDVRDGLAAGKGQNDLVLLDIDNGPEALVHPGNDALYSIPGLVQVRDTLRPQGVLGVWSSAASESFAGRLRSVGFVVTTHNTRARGRKGPRRTIWTCQRR
jgi:spermidine synthase